MRNIKFLLLCRFQLVTVLLFFVSGCDSFVEVDLPSSQLTPASVFEEKATATAAMTDIYSKLRENGLLTGNGSGMSAELGSYTDELNFYGATAVSTQFFYNNVITPSNSTISNWWSKSYNQIYSANAVYEGVSASTKLLPADKNQLMGEALFVRAFVHFYLINLYGDVSYITTTNYEENQEVHRMSTADVYNHIIADLETAQTLLPADYLETLRTRPNRAVATALLARVYLYHGDYALAANAASAVLNETATYGLETDFDKSFLKESQSTIWQFSPKGNGRNTYEGANFIFNVDPPQFVALRSDLLNAFEPGDLRRIHWVREVTNGANTWYHAYKYKQRTITETSMEYSIVFRLSEQYLIRAEARAKQGDIINGKDDLNVIRNLAGLGASTAVTQQDLLDAILKEKWVEFFTEHGHRFFDLKRSNKLDNVLGLTKPGWNSFEALFPIPATELSLNSNLSPQNLGY